MKKDAYILINMLIITALITGCEKEKETNAVAEETSAFTQEAAEEVPAEIEENLDIMEEVEEKEVAEKAMDEETETDVTNENLVDFSQCAIGDMITLGRRNLDDDYSNVENLEWIVLDKKDNFLLLQSMQSVINMRHFAKNWEESEIREWLNDFFYYDSFDENERSLIVKNKSDDLMQTEEYITCLSFDEFGKYSSLIPQIKGYKNSLYEGYLYSVSDGDEIWTRSFGDNQYNGSSAYMTSNGMSWDDRTVKNVCPAMWIDTSITYEKNNKIEALDLSCGAVEVGGKFTFGVWYQDNNYANGKEPIVWNIVDVKDDRVIAMSEKGLDYVGDSSSTINDWMEGMFYYQAFSECDREKMITEKKPKEGYRNVYFLSDEENEYYGFNLITSDVHSYEDTDYCLARQVYRYDPFSLAGTTRESRKQKLLEEKNAERIGQGIRPCISVSMDAFADIPITSTTKYEVGDVVKMGRYEQDNETGNGDEEIEWIVIDSKQGKALLVSKYILDQQIYGTKNGTDKIQNQWMNSTLRLWLNNDFYNESFNEQEKKIIMDTETSRQYSVYDKVFILSEEDKREYGLGVAETTTYARNQGVFGLYAVGAIGDEGFYWFRPSDGLTVVSHPSEVLVQTYVEENEEEVVWMDMERDDIGVRPAMWIKTD